MTTSHSKWTCRLVTRDGFEKVIEMDHMAPRILTAEPYRMSAYTEDENKIIEGRVPPQHREFRLVKFSKLTRIAHYEEA